MYSSINGQISMWVDRAYVTLRTRRETVPMIHITFYIGG